MAEPLVVFVSPQSNINNLNAGDLRMIFKGEPVKIKGKKVAGLNLPTNTEARQLFDRIVLGLEPSQVPKFWIDQRIRGLAKPPRTIPKLPLTLRLINRLTKFIGYGPKSLVKGDVKIITVNGKKPNDPSYLLK